MKHLRSYQLAVNFYRSTKATQLAMPFGDQFRRAAASIVLNLAEGTGKRTVTDQRRFFYIALGSIREIQAIMELCDDKFAAEEKDMLDHLAASVYKLTQWQG